MLFMNSVLKRCTELKYQIFKWARADYYSCYWDSVDFTFSLPRTIRLQWFQYSCGLTVQAWFPTVFIVTLPEECTCQFLSCLLPSIPSETQVKQLKNHKSTIYKSQYDLPFMWLHMLDQAPKLKHFVVHITMLIWKSIYDWLFWYCVIHFYLLVGNMYSYLFCISSIIINYSAIIKIS